MLRREGRREREREAKKRSERRASCAFKIKREKGKRREVEKARAAGKREIRPTCLEPKKTRPKTNRLLRGVVRYASVAY